MTSLKNLDEASKRDMLILATLRIYYFFYRKPLVTFHPPMEIEMVPAELLKTQKPDLQRLHLTLPEVRLAEVGHHFHFRCRP